MDEKRVVAALRNWSENGLCSGVLLKKDQTRTPGKNQLEPCASGCLALEFLHSEDGAQYLAGLGLPSISAFVDSFVWSSEDLADVDRQVAEEADPASRFAESVEAFFGLEPGDVDEIIEFNDNHRDEKCKAGARLPLLVRDTIFELREKYIKLHPEK